MTEFALPTSLLPPRLRAASPGCCWPPGWRRPRAATDGRAGRSTRNDKPGKPDKIVALWSDTVLTQAGRPPIRGFGGRLMFYEGKKEEPIKVEGTLVVYAFDETDRDANNARPDRKYVFTPQQLPLTTASRRSAIPIACGCRGTRSAACRKKSRSSSASNRKRAR